MSIRLIAALLVVIHATHITSAHAAAHEKVSTQRSPSPTPQGNNARASMFGWTGSTVYFGVVTGWFVKQEIASGYYDQHGPSLWTIAAGTYTLYSCYRLLSTAIALKKKHCIHPQEVPPVIKAPSHEHRSRQKNGQPILQPKPRRATGPIELKLT